MTNLESIGVGVSVSLVALGIGLILLDRKHKPLPQTTLQNQVHNAAVNDVTNAINTGKSILQQIGILRDTGDDGEITHDFGDGSHDFKPKPSLN